ncbi:tigger transposable element-derived protein 6 [Rhizoctonia solani]|uniref:Tigger transposable element-derived protein 6 n=1 Tax=Rhizoctonia solani TaxID=456999 RepID=A0A8H8P0P5_9AGAM|nr:tigger transposable element-derived protein 6 [Rhizoctonia solani]QRW22215.1 tigger transposable element-derived protein 6 [Rhizoctonia solani]
MPADCHILRQSLTFQQQLQVAAFYCKNKETLPMGKIVYSLCNQGFSTICCQTILHHVSNKDTTCQYICKDICNSTLSQYQSGVLPALELKLYEWICEKERDGLQLNGYLICKKGQWLACDMDIDPALHRFGIKQYTFHGEAALAPIAELENHKCTIQESPKSGLASQALPGVKADKTRLTYVLGTSATGEKLPPFTIGFASHPCCFTNGPPSNYGFDYASNKKAYLECLNAQMESQGCQILLLCDNTSSHKHDPACTPNIEVYYLPPNLTSWIQPMDAGIIRNFKSNYCWLHTKFVLDCKAAGTLNPYKVHQLDTMHLSQQAWDKVSASSIWNCWQHTGILPKLWEVKCQLSNVSL